MHFLRWLNWSLYPFRERDVCAVKIICSFYCSNIKKIKNKHITSYSMLWSLSHPNLSPIKWHELSRQTWTSMKPNNAEDTLFWGSGEVDSSVYWCLDSAIDSVCNDAFQEQTPIPVWNSRHDPKVACFPHKRNGTYDVNETPSVFLNFTPKQVSL